LVGRIETVGRITSRVLLIVDGGNVVPVKRASDGIAALAIGLGDGRMDLRPLAAGTNPFKAGDLFITSGTGGIYRPGVPVAVGIRRSREGTIARPLADPAQLDFAIVEPEFVAPPPPPLDPLAAAKP
jgi:rod shape-determining protein MreC